MTLKMFKRSVKYNSLSIIFAYVKFIFVFNLLIEPKNTNVSFKIEPTNTKKVK